MAFKSDLYSFITPVVVDDGRFFIDDMFQRKFGTHAPDITNHLVAFYKNQASQFIPVAYVSFLPYKNVLLIGGVMTDGSVIRQMTDAQKLAISDNDGLLYFMLSHGMEHFADRCEAYFAYVNNSRAIEMNLKAGIEHTRHESLMAKFHRPMSRWKKYRTTKVVRQLGPF